MKGCRQHRHMRAMVGATLLKPLQVNDITVRAPLAASNWPPVVQ